MSSKKNKFRLTRFILLKLSFIFRFLAKFRRPAKRLLIIKIDAIGDYILFRNYLEVLHKSERFKDYEIELLGNDSWKDLTWQYDSNLISKYWFINERWLLVHPVNVLKLGISLFKRRYEFVLHPTYSRTLLANGLSALASGKETIAFRSNHEIHPRYKKQTDRFYSTLLDLPEGIFHEYERNHNYFSQILNNPNLPWVELSLPVRETARSGIVIFPGSSDHKRNWQEEKFAELIQRLLDASAEKIILTGGRAEVALSCSIMGRLPEATRLVDQTGDTTLPKLVDLVSQARFVISNDTSVVHIAAACKTPVICIQGGGHFERFTPYSEKLLNRPICVYEKMPCYNCNWECQFQTFINDPYPCISSVNIDAVWKEVNKLLELTSTADNKNPTEYINTSLELSQKITPKSLHKISIITVTLNAARHLERCIKSILSYNNLNIEFIIWDGGSVDGTLDIIKKYEKHISFWKSEKDSGVYDAMNKAVKVATGDWIYFLGADDALLEGTELIVSKFQHPHTIYYGDISYSGQRMIREAYNSYRLANENICHQAIFYPRHVFDLYQYDLKYPIAADWVLNMKLWSDKRFKFEYHPFVIADFSDSGISSMNKDVKFYEDQLSVLRNTLGLWVYLRIWFRKSFK
ncbi:ADP-heptose:LPS heptosyltransferase [Arcticibacter pallidicorallinus]|uniref:ADP-heptose:LPS heptosyltransferase n=1 Tax=Arcticibacter pallidicorallinus TaxID=1259464 RepID=A0A2T0U708_9SPHI|nr:glycosyltransferase [Arcticibacter pallidicorallinus]PRY53694.1 ADP-heptose:LPS heptosyltransferase [Arcticibacter pallidicorallinus]